MNSMLGKQQRVLIEQVDQKGMARGYGEHYLPVKLQSSHKERNIFQRVLLDDLEYGDPPSMKGSAI